MVLVGTLSCVKRGVMTSPPVGANRAVATPQELTINAEGFGHLVLDCEYVSYKS